MEIDNSAMPHANPAPPDDFNAAERAYIRRELDEVLATLPAAADGFLVRTRKTGANAGNPKNTASGPKPVGERTDAVRATSIAQTFLY